MIELFGYELIKPKKSVPEPAALEEILRALNAHPAVAWCERRHSRVMRIEGRLMCRGEKGCYDALIGQLKAGQLLGVEVKAAKGRLRDEQVVFLKHIEAANGKAFVARDCRDVMRELRLM